MIGQVLKGRYRVLRELKEARDGKIYFVVQDLENGNELKMLKGIGLLGPKEEHDANLEINLLRQLDHDYVVKMLDNFQFTAPNGFRYHALILEYLSGGDLAQFFENMLNNEGGENELPWAQNDALRISAQLVLALNYIHGKNIMHRDIKPENILMSADFQQVKIADFNISRVGEETLHTGVAGSMDYLAPEIINNEGSTAPLSFFQDIWAIGIIFQMLCTFRHPFIRRNAFQTMSNIVQNIRRPAEVIFPAMESLIQRCLVVEIGERAESAAALMTHPALVSLIEQLKNRVLPADLTFGLTRIDTTMKINGLLNRENIELKNAVERLSSERDLAKRSNENLKKDVAQLKRENNALNNENNGQKREIQKLNNDLNRPEVIAARKLEADRSKIVRSFGENPAMNGFGHFFGLDSEFVRKHHDEDAVRRVLRAMAAGFTEFNLKFFCNVALEVTEAGWTIRHPTNIVDEGSSIWKLWLLFNGKRVDFQVDADDIDRYGEINNSAKKLTPDKSGMVKLKGTWDYVRWNISLRK